METAYIIAGYYLLTCAAATGLILRIVSQLPKGDE